MINKTMSCCKKFFCTRDIIHIASKNWSKIYTPILIQTVADVSVFCAKRLQLDLTVDYKSSGGKFVLINKVQHNT